MFQTLDRQNRRAPRFSESQHPSVAALADRTDIELLRAFQQFPDSSRYFVALFCRYGPLLHTLAARAAAEPVGVDYLFALSWRHIFYELRGLDVYQLEAVGQESLRSWLVEMLGFCARHVQLPPAEAISYDVAAAPPPLWCHLEAALDTLSPLERLTLLLTQSGGWSLAQVAAWVAEHGAETASIAELEACLQVAYQQLERALPGDLREIYLTPPAQ